MPLERYTLDIEIVERTWHALSPLLEYMGVDHRGRYILVTQQGLDGPNIGAALEKMGGKTVAERVGADTFRQSQFTGKGLYQQKRESPGFKTGDESLTDLA